MKPSKKTVKSDQIDMKDFVITFITPTLIGKTLIVYFGLHYSSYPDQGYGYGLILTIAFTLTMIARFLWRYRHYSEDH